MRVRFKIMSEHWGPGENYEVEFNRRHLMRQAGFRKARGRHIYIGGAIQRNPNFKQLLHNGGK